MRLDKLKRDFRDWKAQQSKAKLIIAGLIVVSVLYVLSGIGYGSDYQEKVGTEMKVARLICENSWGHIKKNPKLLRIGTNKLDDFQIDGERVELDHVPYPKVIFNDSGIHQITIGDKKRKTHQEIYCEIRDPRSQGRRIYYSYASKSWDNALRFRR